MVFVGMIVIGIGCGVVGLVVGAVLGGRSAYRIVRTETVADLGVAKERGDLQLYEYLKSRYYLLSNRAKIRLRLGEGDYGPVDATKLAGYYPGKDLTSFDAEYEEYKRTPGFR